MSRTGNVNATDGSGFNPFQFITDVMNAIENLAANELAGGLTNEGAQCIRQVIEVHKRMIQIYYCFPGNNLAASCNAMYKPIKA